MLPSKPKHLSCIEEHLSFQTAQMDTLWEFGIAFFMTDVILSLLSSLAVSIVVW